MRGKADFGALATCERLFRAGVVTGIRPGDTVARGFADAGYDVCVVDPEGRFLDPETKVVRDDGDDPHYFRVPSLEELLREGSAPGFGSVSVRCGPDGRWTIGDDRADASGATLFEAAASFVVTKRFGAAADGSRPGGGRRLVSVPHGEG